MNRRQADRVRDARLSHNSWVENLLRPLVIGAMVGCVAWSLVQLVWMISPTGNPVYLAAVCVLAAVEAYYSYRLLQTPRMRGTDITRFRLVELALIFMLLRTGRYIARGVNDLLAEIQTWSRDPLALFDTEAIVAMLLTLLCWSAATLTARDLDQIGEPAHRDQTYVPPIERLINRFFGGGAVLLVAAGLTRMGSASELVNLRRPSVKGLVFNVLLYFLLGLVMLGQARYVELRKRWQRQNIQVTDAVNSRWARYSLSFIGLAALLAFVLPTEFTAGFMNWAASSLGIVGSILVFIVSMLFTILSLPFAWLFWLLSLLMGSREPAPEPAMPTFEPPPPAPSNGGAAPAWFDILRALVFWILVVGVMFYVIRTYLRDRAGLRDAIAKFRAVQMLHRGWVVFWHWLRGWTGHLRQTVGELLPRRLSRLSSVGESLRLPFRFFRLGALSPRERVLYYYLSVLRRADQRGYPRRRHQTPKEYQTNLEPQLPQARQDLEELTQAFVEARYSQHQVVSDQDREVRKHWEQVKIALRALKRQQDRAAGDADSRGKKDD